MKSKKETVVPEIWKDEEVCFLNPVIAKSFGEQYIVYSDEGESKKHYFQDLEKAKQWCAAHLPEDGGYVYSFIVDANTMEIIDVYGGDYFKDDLDEENTFISG